jgi:hypothetical protein
VRAGRSEREHLIRDPDDGNRLSREGDDHRLQLREFG